MAASKILVPVEEYLRTSFEGPDCEYLDGEIVERNVGEQPHSVIQSLLCAFLFGLRGRLGIFVLPEIRIQIHSRRYRVADIAVWREPSYGERIPSRPPFLAVEVLSPEDRMVRIQPKIQEYLGIGVEWVWVIDPEERKALCYSRDNPGGAACDVLCTENPHIELPLAQLFDDPYLHKKY